MRVEKAWLLVLFAVGAALAFVPLFDVLGYEFCLALAPLSALMAAHVGIARTLEERRARPASAVTAADARPLDAVARLYLATLARALVLLGAPLAIISANALRVRNCDFVAGLGWFFFLPVLSAATGAALGVLVGLARGWRSWLWPAALAAAFIVGSVLVGVWRFLAAPPIFGYDPFVGYFAGTLYDEDLVLPAAFAWARLYHLAAAAAALALAAALLDGASLRVRAPPRHARPLVLFFAAAALALGLSRRSAELGFHLDAADVARALGAEKETAHFVLHYSASGPYGKEIDLYAQEHELRYAQLARWFGAAPAGKVHAFLFDNVAQKRALMGAGHTFIAKPWRREIYLQHEGWPQSVVMHELAHVFAGRFGDRWFGIARVGASFNVGLIEGVAVAASFHTQPLTPHQTVKALRVAGAVDARTLAAVMGPRFFGLNAASAYAVAGSFCRFLADTRGVDKLMRVFSAAGSDASWRAVYGRDFDALANEWLARVDAEVLPEATARLVQERLKRPSVFHVVCAHAQALARQAALAAAQAGNLGRARAAWDAICADVPSVDNLADALDAAVAAGDRGRARTLAERMLARPDVDAVARGRAEAALGDLALASGDGDAALAAYDAALALPADEGTLRLLTVKRLVARWPAGPSRAALAPILLGGPGRDAALDLASLQKLADRDRERALYHYLLGRQLFSRGRFAEAADELMYPASDRLPDARFDREAKRVLGISLFRAGRLADARARFVELAADGDATAPDWIERCDFAAAGRL